MTDSLGRAAPIQGSSSRRHLTFGFDTWLLVLVVILISFGLVMVYSASWDVSWRMHGDPNALFRLQVLHLGLGLLAMLGAGWFPIDWLRRLAVYLMLGTIIALLAVLIVNAGSEHRRAFLSGSVQPSELAKLALVIYLAVWMESKGERLADMGYGFWPLIMIMGVIGGLIMLQPDLSATITVGVVALIMFYIAGASLWQVMAMALGGGHWLSFLSD
jgi:cell division protein FtsW